MRAAELEILRKRTSNFSQGVDISENMQRIDIELMLPSPDDWNYMPLPRSFETSRNLNKILRNTSWFL